MRVIVAPEPLVDIKGPTVFLAGGITGCPDWQSQVIDRLSDLDICVFNPRRQNFDVNDKSVSASQISWEYCALRVATIVSFWFCKETIQPIALYELGAALMRNEYEGQIVLVGVDPEYVRKFDVIAQTNIVSPTCDSLIVPTLDEHVDNIRSMIEVLFESGFYKE